MMRRGGAPDWRDEHAYRRLAALARPAPRARIAAAGERVMDAKREQVSRHPDVGSGQPSQEPAMANERDQLLERQQLGFGLNETGKSIMQDDRRAGQQAAVFDVEPDMLPAVGQDDMLDARFIHRGRQPGRQERGVDRIGVRRSGRRRGRADSSGIEIGMPDDPGIGS